MPKKLYDLTGGSIQIEAEFEIGRRLGFSSLSHVFLFSVVLFSTPLLDLQTWLTVSVGAGLTAISLSRFLLSRRQKNFYPEKRKTWMLLFDGSLVMTAGLWGILCEEVLRNEGFLNSPASAILLITAGISAGAANSLNPSFNRAVTFIGLVLGIPFVYLCVSAFQATPMSAAFATIFLIYFSFLTMQIRSQHEIFWSLLRTKEDVLDFNRKLDEQVRERTKKLATTEAKLVEAAKMAALGEMAGGIAHEINTPLGVIALSAEYVGDLINTGDVDRAAIAKSMQTINETVNRISTIIKGLRRFSRDAGVDQLCSASAKQIVEDTLTLCRQKIYYAEIEVRIRPIGDDLQMHCRSVQISQVLLNLISNACDAIRELPEKWIEISVQPTPAGIEISVTDSGRGISESVRAKLFQPFFTTKAIGKGTGLGLSISMGIMESHQGTLTLDPESPHTRFVLFLPDRQNLSSRETQKQAA